MPTEKNRRVQFEMPARSYERMRALQEMTEATSYSEVVRNALQLYEAAVKAEKDGGFVYVRKADGTEAPVF